MKQLLQRKLQQSEKKSPFPEAIIVMLNIRKTTKNNDKLFIISFKKFNLLKCN
uniref:Uncharacterized protein n=1 Tax=Meloidogyne enterolobii TaxID=390850 RepID=A0A6V7UQI1_MELEN|nr:unnamed protein product [Meloidogyne enterolobii]